MACEHFKANFVFKYQHFQKLFIFLPWKCVLIENWYAWFLYKTADKFISTLFIYKESELFENYTILD